MGREQSLLPLQASYAVRCHVAVAVVIGLGRLRRVAVGKALPTRRTVIA